MVAHTAARVGGGIFSRQGLSHSQVVCVTSHGTNPELKRRKKQQPNFQRTDRGKNHVCAENLTADLSVRQAKGVDFSAKD